MQIRDSTDAHLIALMKSDVCSLNFAGQLINAKGIEYDMPQFHTANESWHNEEEIRIQTVTWQQEDKLNYRIQLSLP